MSKLQSQIHNLKRLLKIVRWYFSKDKKIFDLYVNQFKELIPFSESEAERYQQVATIRKAIFVKD